MPTSENEKTWLENQLEKYIKSVLGLPKTLRNPRYFIAIILILFLFLFFFLFSLFKTEIFKTVFVVKTPPEQPETTPIPTPPLPVPILQYRKSCGDRPFDTQSLKSRISESMTQSLRPPIMIQLSGALSHQVAEGNGSAAFAVARFTICTGDSVAACPEPKLDCSVRCKYSRADFFAGNALIATDELAELLASGIDDAQRLDSPITEGNLCKTR